MLLGLRQSLQSLIALVISTFLIQAFGIERGINLETWSREKRRVLGDVSISFTDIDAKNH